MFQGHIFGQLCAIADNIISPVKTGTCRKMMASKIADRTLFRCTMVDFLMKILGKIPSKAALTLLIIAPF